MQLVYFWIENYGVIKNKGVLLNQEYKIDFLYAENKGELIIEKTENEIPKNFFSYSKNESIIKNISCIIGGNGSGKTSIIHALFSTKNKINKSKYIKIYRVSDNELKLITNIDLIEIKNKTNYLNIKKTDDEDEMDCLFYTNSLEMYELNLYSLKNVYDISYKNELRNFKLSASSEGIINPTGEDYLNYMNNQFLKRLLLSKIKQIKKEESILNYISFPEMQKIIQNRLKKVKVELRNIEISENGKKFNEYYEKILKFDKRINKYKFINNFFKEAIEIFIVKELKENELSFFYDKIEALEKINIEYTEEYEELNTKLENFKEKKEEKEKLEKQLKKIKENKMKKDLENICNALLEIEENLLKYPFLKTKIEFIKETIEILFDMEEYNNKKGKMKLILNLEKNSNVLEKFFFLDYTIQELLTYKIFNVSFDEYFSSGEKSLLEMVLRVEEVLERIKNKESLLFIIEEPESFLHPEWQRKNIDLLIKFSEIFKLCGIKNLQYLLTSHTPLIIGDLPKGNIVSLNNENAQCVTGFGSNLLDILKNDFELSSFFGEFSKNKIKKVIDILSKDKGGKIKFKEIEKNKEEIEFIIKSLGETLIKNKLERMYFELEKEDPVQKIKKLMKEKGVTLEDLKKGDI
ncbi:ATP-binding protein (plasmid) [Cetobacterium somerae]|uniref:ATP-binding protein n=1 Tax=Cetobacterium somerae TaxID=188913 RepID=UPI001F061EFE|nr:ATP-binding protein [Cetobacterium somerae]UPO98412.1 ATP-binding protein [Cetobacterium somerae]